jgi:hypothetical protein
LDSFFLVSVKLVNIHSNRLTFPLLNGLIKGALKFWIKLDLSSSTRLLRSTHYHALIVINTRIDIDLQLLVDGSSVFGSKLVSQTFNYEVLG